eukprot:GEMP01043317.1.p1 GENE.GEMP01043317.1~~GEMP01043317.1.p1  ORF type:complete len:434 (+),score=95.43 GEMP01043317.1:30-1304(+)
MDELAALDHSREDPSLAIPYASIGDDSCADIAKFLKSNGYCEFLDLRGNSIGPKGGMMLADALKGNQKLKSLCLKWNLIGKDPAAVEALCKALYSNMSLCHLDLRNNRVCPAGTWYLAELLRQNTSLTQVDLSWNELGPEGGKYILDAMCNNNTVVELQLSGSKVGDDILHEVSFILRRNRAAQAYKASKGETAIERPLSLSSPTTMSTSRSPRGFGFSTPKTLRSGDSNSVVGPTSPTDSRARKIDGALMTKLIMKEREAISLEDKQFFRDAGHLLEKLQLCAKNHERARQDAEERERLTTCGFVSNEQQFAQKIRSYEEELHSLVKEKDQIRQAITGALSESKQADEELRMILHDTMIFQEQAVSRESEAGQAFQEIMSNQHALRKHMESSKKELDTLLKENARLRGHIQAFQRDVSEIMVQ